MQEDPIVIRVVSRFQREVVATFIPDKWFKAKRVELTSVLKTPIQGHRSEMWSYLLLEKVGGFLVKFEEEFKSLVTFEPALESVHRRVNEAQEALKGIASSLDLVGDHTHYDFKDPVQYLEWRAHSDIYEKIADNTKVLGGFLKWAWSIDEVALNRLVQKTIKKATPEQLEALVAEDNEHAFKTGYQFLSEVRFEEAALRTLKRTKLDKFDPLKWLDWTYEVLKSNYTEQAVVYQDAYREFDMYGMKVVIKDNTVTSDDIKKYIKYIDEAHTKMKSKGFEKAWYGTFYIECEKCGGVNRNTGGGVAGHYVIGPDTVSCFERPSIFVVELLVHELGHRYWYKKMTPAQRGHFESLVKVRPTPIRPAEDRIPAFTIPEEKAQAAQDKVDKVAEPLRKNLELFRKSKLRWFTKIIDAFFQPIADAAWAFNQDLNSAVHSSGTDSSVNQTVRKALLEVIELTSELHVTCMQMDDTLKKAMNSYPDGTDFNQAFRVERGKWLEKTLELLNRTVEAAHHYITIGVEATNKYESSKGKKVVEDWDRRYQEDTRPVAPVSDYGESNISEAFAEAFTHYVLEMDMNRDQIESFRSVFSSIDPIITLVAQRYLQGIS